MITVKKEYTPEQAKAFVRRCDRKFDAKLEETAKSILEQRDEQGNPVRIVALTGPSCSGKTTCAKKLSSVFAENGKHAITVSIDDFYINRQILLERAKGGAPDFDSPDTINTDTLKKCIDDIFDDTKTRIDIPIYDFKTGTVSGYRRVCPEPDRSNIYIFEGIQAFYSNVQELFKGHPTASIFINTFGKLKADGEYVSGEQVRFLRRVVRDYLRRGCPPEYTYQLWKGVRANEETHIFPNAVKADYKIDSLVGYDLSMLRPYAEGILENVRAEDEFCPVADEILNFLEKIGPIKKSCLADSSIFHEFI